MTIADTSRVKRELHSDAVRRHSDLVALADRIHAHPEPAWEEHRAAAWVGDALAESGFSVTARAFGLDTAVHATLGSGRHRIALVAEYDALPGLGHACGHNLIAA